MAPTPICSTLLDQHKPAPIQPIRPIGRRAAPQQTASLLPPSLTDAPPWRRRRPPARASARGSAPPARRYPSPPPRRPALPPPFPRSGDGAGRRPPRPRAVQALPARRSPSLPPRRPSGPPPFPFAAPPDPSFPRDGRPYAALGPAPAAGHSTVARLRCRKAAGTPPSLTRLLRPSFELPSFNLPCFGRFFGRPDGVARAQAQWNERIGRSIERLWSTTGSALKYLCLHRHAIFQSKGVHRTCHSNRSVKGFGLGDNGCVVVRVVA